MRRVCAGSSVNVCGVYLTFIRMTEASLSVHMRLCNRTGWNGRADRHTKLVMPALPLMVPE